MKSTVPPSALFFFVFFGVFASAVIIQQPPPFVDILPATDEGDVGERDPQVDSTARYSGHFVAIRPDYNIWSMLHVLRNMFDSPAARSASAEKRHPRDVVDYGARQRRLFSRIAVPF